jgi:hypothetical protein
MIKTHWIDRAVAFIKMRTWPQYVQGSEPTVRELARRYGVSQQSVVDALSCHELVSMNVGIQVEGMGGGVVAYDSIGDYSFEWLD